MKKIYYTILAFLCFACSSEDANDCFQTSGTILQTPIEVAAFTKIRIERNVSLIVQQGTSQKVVLETGENLRSDVLVYVEDDVLIVRDENGCNLLRDFGITKVYVTTPNLVEIRNGSSFDVTGIGILRFPELRLISNTTGGFESIRKSGDFTLQLDTQNLRVDANGSSGFYLNGKATNASISFEDEVPRFEGANLVIDELTIFQRSSNVMIVNPQIRISGKIVGIGDVISVNRPPMVDVEELNSGRLLFQ